MEDVEKICVPSWRGLKFVRKIHAHLNSNTLTDEQALRCLKNGALTVEDFSVLPPNFIKDKALKKRLKKGYTVKELIAFLQDCNNLKSLESLLEKEKRAGSIRKIEGKIKELKG